MAEQTVKRRLTRAERRLERQRRRARSAAPPRRFPPRPDFRPFPPWDDGGGAGVREPRRPVPTAPAGGLVLDEPEFDQLDLAAYRR